MAINKNTEFKGQVAGEIYMAIFQEADTMSKGLITSMENIGSDVVYIPETDVDAGWQDYSCKFESVGDINLSEVKAELKKLKYNMEYCHEDLKRWSAPSMMGKSLGVVPKDEVDAIMQNLEDKFKFNFEKMLWNGDATKTGEFLGFIPQLASVKEVVNLDAPDAVVSALELAIDSTDEAILASPHFKLVVSADIARKYARALNLRGFEQDALFIDGYKIETANGLLKNTILTYDKRNLNVVSDLLSEFSNISVLDQSHNGDDMTKVKATFKATTAIVNVDKVVYITNA